MIRRGLAVPALSFLAACSASPANDETPPREIRGGVLVGEQTYDVPAADAWKAADAALEGGALKVERRRRDDCGGKIVARREDGHRVTVTIHAPERSSAEIMVVVEPGDQELLDAIQKRIGDKLSLKKARSALLGDTFLESSYEVDLGAGFMAAERTCHVLGLEVEVRKRGQQRARLEARDRDGRLVRFSLRQSDGSSPGTEFVISTPPSGGDEKEFLRKIRRELEHHLFPSSE